MRFRRVVRPGDELTLQVDLERLSRRGGWGRATASVDGAETCRARLLFAFAGNGLNRPFLRADCRQDEIRTQTVGALTLSY